MSKIKRDKHLDKLRHKYDVASCDLKLARDKAFPIGSKWLDTYSGMKVTVQQSSLYADQIKTDIGHISWWHLERIEEN